MCPDLGRYDPSQAGVKRPNRTQPDAASRQMWDRMSEDAKFALGF